MIGTTSSTCSNSLDQWGSAPGAFSHSRQSSEENSAHPFGRPIHMIST